MASDPQSTVEGFMTAIVEARFDDARSLLHEDFVVYEAGGVPFSGEYHGPAGFFELFGKMNDAMELSPGETVQYLVADDTVAMRYRLKFHRAGLGPERRDESGRNLYGP